MATLEGEGEGEGGAALLPFQQAILEDLIDDDGGGGREREGGAQNTNGVARSSMVVLGEGLGLHTILAQLIAHAVEEREGQQEKEEEEEEERRKRESSRRRLVILIGFTAYQRKCILSALARERGDLFSNKSESERVGEIDSGVGGVERSRLYAKGGALFITTRILTVDLLQGRLSPLRVFGMYVGSAHRVKDDSGEAFCVRLYRGTDAATTSSERVSQNTIGSSNNKNKKVKIEPNKFGFVHAFTDEPTAFAGTFKVEHVMKALHVRRLFLWPRFETRVQASLQPTTPVVDLEEDTRPSPEKENRDQNRNRNEDKVPELHMPEVVEFSIPVTRSMELIQTSLASAMDACLKELGHHKFLGLEFDLTVSNNLFRDFGRSIQRQLDKRWHLVSRKTKQITRDLSTLRRLAFCVLRYDGPTFLQYLEMVRATEGVHSIWLFLDDAHVVFEEAKSRVYKLVTTAGDTADVDGGEKKGKKKQKQKQKQKEKEHDVKSNKEKAPSTSTHAQAQATLQHKVVPVLEQPAKWEYLKQILEEIQQDRTKMIQAGSESHSSESQGAETQGKRASMYPVLVLTQESLVCTQIQHFLVMGGEAIMKDAFNQYLEWRSISTSKTHGTKSEKKKSSDYTYKMTGAAGVSMRSEDRALQAAASVGKNKRKRGATPQKRENAAAEENLGTPWLAEGVHFYALEGKELELELYRIKPAFVILYDQSPSAIRQLEVYSASTILRMQQESNTGGESFSNLLRIYMLFYSESLEQQKFCAAVDRERRVFRSLIEQKATMLVPIAEDGSAVVEKHNPRDTNLSPSKPLLPFGAGSSANNAITRQAGGLLSLSRKKAGSLIVDMREFSSNLPGVLHAHGFEIVPCTLEVGDYILSPEICVERKAIPDLIASFGSGRLYQQALSMSKHYKYPVLLIEFSGEKAFALQGVEDWSSGNDISQRALGSKLSLLAIHVPRLRIIWSRSPQATADIFLQLKSNQEEPNLEVAQAVGVPEDPHLRNLSEPNAINQPAIDVLQKLPGVLQSNWRGLARKAESLSQLASMSEQELRDVMKSSKGAKALYNLLNSPCVGVPSIT